MYVSINQSIRLVLVGALEIETVYRNVMVGNRGQSVVNNLK